MRVRVRACLGVLVEVWPVSLKTQLEAGAPDLSRLAVDGDQCPQQKELPVLCGVGKCGGEALPLEWD